MADIRINDLPTEATPTASDNLAIDGASTRKATIQTVVNAGAPVASQAQAETGSDNNARMTPLTTKQSISSEVGVTVASQANGVLASTAVQPSRQIIAGSGLTGGGDLSLDRTFNVGAGTGITVNADDVSLSETTISRLIPSGGTADQVLSKVNGSDYNVAWTTVSAATAVSYTPQSLTLSQKAQSRENISTVWEPIVPEVDVSGVSNATFTIPSSYKEFEIRIRDCNPNTASAVVSCRLSFDNGATYKQAATDYHFNRLRCAEPTSIDFAAADGSQMSVMPPVAASLGRGQSFFTLHPGSASEFAHIFGRSNAYTTTTLETWYFDARYVAATQRATNIMVLLTSGSFVTGYIQILGRR